jgi:signal transduction histidine kinase
VSGEAGVTAVENSSKAWARRLSPQSQAGTAKGLVLAAGAALVIGALLLQDVMILPGYSSLPLSLLLVAGAGWTLGPRALLLVASAAATAHLVETWHSHWGWMIGLFGMAGIGLVATASHQAAMGRASHRMLEEQIRRVKELAFLLEITEQLAATLDEETILQSAVQAVAKSVSRRGRRRPPRAAYHEIRGESLFIRVESDQAGTIGFEHRFAGQPAAAQVAQSERATQVSPEKLGVLPPGLAAKLDIKVLLCAPVKVGRRTVGLLVAAHSDSSRVEPHELRLLEVLARTTGLAIGNAEHLRREREHAERMAALEKAKAELLNLASHELRGPLTVARGYVSMLFDATLGTLPNQQSDSVSIIHAKLTEMELLVDQMLEASRLEENRLRLRRQLVDLRQLTHEAVCATRPLLGDRGNLVFTPPNCDVPVMVDRERIVTIIANLLSNAVKYSPSSQGADVRCTVSRTENRARVSVRDGGLGIAPDDLHRLFTRFGRIVTAENSNISGAGLGLFVSRELAREHGGDITVISAPGQGSEFTLELPIC